VNCTSGGYRAIIDTAFATLAEKRTSAVIVSADPLYVTRARQLAVLAARHVVPMLSAVREITVAGGLLSYGNSARPLRSSTTEVIQAIRRKHVWTPRTRKT